MELVLYTVIRSGTRHFWLYSGAIFQFSEKSKRLKQIAVELANNFNLYEIIDIYPIRSH